jgi:ribose 5-phosphate isomerase RpiB
VVGEALASELVTTFLASRFKGAARHRPRLAKVTGLEIKETTSWKTIL